MNIAALALLVFIRMVAHAGPYSSSCASVSAKGIGDQEAQWVYCVHQSDALSQDLILILPSFMATERAFETDFQLSQLKNILENQKSPAPNIVTVSLQRRHPGDFWLLIEKANGQKSGEGESFWRDLWPTIKTVLRPVKGHKILLGQSMGGFNAIQLLIDHRLDLKFDRLILLCPMFPSVSPFSTDQELTIFKEYV